MNFLKIISDILPIPSYGSIVIALFFPFFLIKCGDSTLVSVKGIDLITGIERDEMSSKMTKELENTFGGLGGESKDLYSKTNQDSTKEDTGFKDGISMNPFIIAMAVLSLLGLILSFIRKIPYKPYYHIAFSLLGLLSLLLFYTTFQNALGGFEEMGSSASFLKDLSIRVEYGFSFYFCCVVFILLLLYFAFYTYYLNNQSLFVPKKE